MKREKCGLCKLNLDIVTNTLIFDPNICVKCQLSGYQDRYIRNDITVDVPPKWIGTWSSNLLGFIKKSLGLGRF